MNSKRRKEKLGIAGRGPGLLGRKQLSQHHRWSTVVHHRSNKPQYIKIRPNPDAFINICRAPSQPSLPSTSLLCRGANILL